MTWPYSNLPENYFQGAGRISGDPPDDLQSVLNRLRQAVGEPEFYVDPDDTGAYETINAAVEAADTVLPSGQAIIVKIAAKDHNLEGGQLIPPVGRDLRIYCVTASRFLIDSPNSRINGDILFPDAAMEAVRRVFYLEGTTLTGDLTCTPNWDQIVISCFIRGDINRTHGTKGSFFYGEDLTFQGSITDTDANSSGVFGNVIWKECRWNGAAVGVKFTFVSGVVFRIASSYFECGNNPYIFDLGGSGSNSIRFYTGSNFVINSGDTTFITGGAGTIYVFGNNNIRASSGFDFGTGLAWQKVEGQLVLYCPSEPLNSLWNLVWWIDQRTGETLTQDADGSWSVGIYKRREFFVDISSLPAADHDIGWDVPSTAAVIKTSMKVLKLLTGGGGATGVGFGTKVAGDPDKYGEAALAASSKDQKLNPTWNDGAGDDLGITATDGAGVATGTVAGSNDEDIQVMVWTLDPLVIP